MVKSVKNKAANSVFCVCVSELQTRSFTENAFCNRKLGFLPTLRQTHAKYSIYDT
nr:MAG TPA: hypothetical protein [Caudoviricetes sp.]